MSSLLERRTRIVCTIGPATESEERIRDLLRAGMDVARLNFSHGTHEWHRERVHLLRRLAAEMGRSVAILQDLCGPKFRVGQLPEEGVELRAGGRCRLGGGAAEAGPEPRIPVPLPELLAGLSPGDPVYFRDAQLAVQVERRDGEELWCRVVTPGVLKTRQGVTAPTVALAVSAATEKDLRDVGLAVELGLDWVALSFVRQAADLEPVRALLQAGGSPARLMAKIEKPQALQNLESILAAADALMIARGDLGVETPLPQVPMVQKRIIARCNALGKPVITATQMLESMMESPRPTRAEVTDVANAILDGTDAVMLSGETAAGRWPAETVRMMHEIALATEAGSPFEARRRAAERAGGIDDSLARGACEMAADVGAAALLCWTRDGHSARLLSRLRPSQPILAVTPSAATARQLALSWGVQAREVPDCQSAEERLGAALEHARAQGVPVGATVAMMAGIGGEPGLRAGRLVELLTVPEG